MERIKELENELTVSVPSRGFFILYSYCMCVGQKIKVSVPSRGFFILYYDKMANKFRKAGFRPLSGFLYSLWDGVDQEGEERAVSVPSRGFFILYTASGIPYGIWAGKVNCGAKPQFTCFLLFFIRNFPQTPVFTHIGAKSYILYFFIGQFSNSHII